MCGTPYFTVPGYTVVSSAQTKTYILQIQYYWYGIAVETSLESGMRRAASILLGALPAAVTFSDLIASVAVVNGDSMQPTLNPHGDGFRNRDVVLLDKTTKPDKGDIVVLRSPESVRQLVVKRLIGKDGDWVKRRSGGLAHVPTGKIWVEGDNEDTSVDSDRFGPVPISLLQARASHIVWPPSRWCRLECRSASKERLFIMSQNNGDFPRRQCDDNGW
jgi:mitochondrial inner membrane protease subunit 2